MDKTNDLIFEATSTLTQLIQIPIRIDSYGGNFDALISIKSQQFIVETKSTVRTSNQGLVLSQLEEIRQQSQLPIILIADYISKKATEEFKKRGFNYIDSAGNAFIKCNDLVVLIDGQKKAKQTRTNQSRAFQEAGIKILFHLLNKPENLQDSYRKIAEKAGVSIGSVSNVLAELEELNFLLKTDDKRVLKNIKELIERWIVEFNAVLRPRIVRKRMSFLDQEEQRNWQKLETQSSDGGILWGGEPGGALLTNNLRPELFVIFTDLELSVLAKKFRLIPSENGEIEVLHKFWKNDLGNHKTAPALLIYADLINSGFGRNIEIAKQIRENELKYI